MPPHLFHLIPSNDSSSGEKSDANAICSTAHKGRRRRVVVDSVGLERVVTTLVKRRQGWKRLKMRREREVMACLSSTCWTEGRGEGEEW